MTCSYRIASAALLCAALVPAHAAAPLEYTGICNASAAIAIGKDSFLVADDEDNILRLYDANHGGGEQARYDFSKQLDLDGQKKKWEVDIEGAARIGERVYWIGSHGTNSSGEERLKRQQIFATDIGEAQGQPTVTWVGRYTGLLEAMNKAPGIGKDTLVKASKRVPEKDNGLNIEGLAASPDGRLLIGFRGPLVGDKALVLVLDNPATLFSAKPEPKFSAAITLPLGGRGIRSIDYAPQLKAYLIVAGASGSSGDFKLYKWSGKASAVPEALAVDIPAGLRPEALFARADGAGYTLLSDDGDDCKPQAPAFRGFNIKP